MHSVAEENKMSINRRLRQIDLSETIISRISRKALARKAYKVQITREENGHSHVNWVNWRTIS